MLMSFFITCALLSTSIISNELLSMCKAPSNKLEIIALEGIGLRVLIDELMKQGENTSMYTIGVGTLQVISGILLITLLL